MPINRDKLIAAIKTELIRQAECGWYSTKERYPLELSFEGEIELDKLVEVIIQTIEGETDAA